MALIPSVLVLLFVTSVLGQRGSFAGTRPIGYPDTPNKTTTTVDGLADRFGEGTTQRLPVEANGDRELVDRLSKLPIDQQPFWLLNWKALEEQRKNPQTYPQRPNSFLDPQNTNTANTDLASRFGAPNTGNSNSPSSNSNSASANSGQNIQPILPSPKKTKLTSLNR